ncbi:MAG: response regulator transcription factor [Saprospiraceae bacterium]|nr:response regulator transcription factor [Saprospiraceae bacterium]
MAIRVVIYEDNSNLRGALAALIGGAEGFELAGAFGDCNDVVAQVGALKPNVVIMDVDMPGTNGIEGVSLMKKAHPQVEAMMLTVFDDDDRVFNAVVAGASGYLLKKTPPEQILQAVQELMQGGAPMSPTIARKVLQLFSVKPAQQDSELDKLSAREIEVLQWLSKGFSQKMVATELNISLETVRTHVKRIYEKLHVHSIAEAISKTYLRNQ